jgi:hypothetical protein
MIRLLARFWAKWEYVWKHETEAARNDLNAGLALKTADDKRALVKAFEDEAAVMKKRVAKVTEMEGKGFWLCEDGHEEPLSTAFEGIELELSRNCSSCQKPMKHIRRDLMTGQEKYESDKDRNDVEKMIKEKRQLAEAEKDNVKGSEDASKYFRNLATHGRQTADKIRAL